MLICSASTSEQLNEVIDEVHDLFFSVDDLAELRDGILSLSLFDGRSGKPLRRLVIGCVEKVDIVDTEKVGDYDINALRFRDGVLEIATGTPLSVRLAVSQLEVSVLSN